MLIHVHVKIVLFKYILHKKSYDFKIKLIIF